MLLQLVHIVNIWAVLLSTIGIASYQHYCQDKLKSVALFANVLKPCCKKNGSNHRCGAVPLATACCSKKGISCHKKTLTSSSQKQSLKKGTCCKDKQTYQQADIETTLKKIELSVVAIVLNPVISYKTYFIRAIEWTQVLVKMTYPFKCYFPPPKAPIHILHESFLC